MTALIRGAATLAILLLLAGCGSTPKKRFDYGPYVTSDPRSVLVVAETAGRYRKDWFLATITQPLAERGYYVMPVRMSKKLATQAGFKYRFPTPKHVKKSLRRRLKKKPERLKKMEAHWQTPTIEDRAAELAAFFGADSVLFVDVLRWDNRRTSKAGLLEFNPPRTHTVWLDYHLKDNRGQTLWRAKQQIMITRKGGSDALQKLWKTATNMKASELETHLAREANRTVIEGKKHRRGRRSYRRVYPMLVGPYHPRYERDRAKRRGIKKP